MIYRELCADHQVFLVLLAQLQVQGARGLSIKLCGKQQLSSQDTVLQKLEKTLLLLTICAHDDYLVVAPTTLSTCSNMIMLESCLRDNEIHNWEWGNR